MLAKVEKKVFAAMLEELTEYCDDGVTEMTSGCFFFFCCFPFFVPAFFFANIRRNDDTKI